MWSNYRLQKTWKFTSSITKGKKMVNHNFLTFFTPNHLNNCLFGISIPRKLVRKAVKRNYYKRQVKNMLIHYLQKNNNSCQQSHYTMPFVHYNIIVIIRTSYLDMNETFKSKQESLHKLLSSLFQKLKSSSGENKRKNLYA